VANYLTNSIVKFTFCRYLGPYSPTRSSAVGTTECTLIYYFSTVIMESPGITKGHDVALPWALQCIKFGVLKVRMSDRNTVNKL